MRLSIAGKGLLCALLRKTSWPFEPIFISKPCYLVKWGLLSDRHSQDSESMLHVLALTTKDQRQQNCHSKKCRNARGNSIDHFKERSFFYFLSVAIKLRLAGFWSSKRARKTDHHYTYSLLLPFIGSITVTCLA